jgi:hypothetical protein
LQAALAEDSASAYTGYYADLTGLSAEPLAVPAELAGVLAVPEASEPAGQDTAYYELSGLEAGTSYTVHLNSPVFDPYLTLIDQSNQKVIYDNDDFDGSYSDSQFSFTAEEGISYWVQITDPYTGSGGSYTISLAVAEMSDDLASYSTHDTFLEGYTALPLEAGATLEGSLVAAPSSTKLANYYELTGLNVGDSVTVNFSSDAFDTYLALIDTVAQEYLMENDYGDDSVTASLTFTVEEGRTYWLEASSYYSDQGGDYSLSVAVSPAGSSEPELTAEDLPSFKDLLELVEMLPKAVRVLANHSSTSEAYSTLEGNDLYSHGLMKLAW